MALQKKLDAVKFVDDYLKKTSWETKENSNIPFSFSSLFFRGAGEVISRYTLAKIYPPAVARAHTGGDFHLHNLYMGITGYCCGWSLGKLLREGFGGAPGRLTSAPARHLDTALLQMANFLGTVQNEWSGAQAINSVDTLLAPFVAKDGLGYPKVKQAIQTFVYNMNVASRWGGQSPFTNITFDWQIPKDMRRAPAIIGGREQREAYGDFQHEADLINRAFIEVYSEGDAASRPFTFPIPTYSITKDFDWDGENARRLFDMAAQYGLPYFSNFVSTGLAPSDIRSMCCRLRLDMRQLKRNITGGLFGSADMTGSVGVVTLNMPRLGYLARNEGRFFDMLDARMELAQKSLEIKRRVVAKNIRDGLLPYSKRYLGGLDNFFSTIGLLGMNEACRNFLGVDIADPQGKHFAVKTLRHMLARLEEFQRDSGNLYNLEATPAEGASYRLARLDKRKYPRIITAGKREPYYTNSTLLPADKTDDVVWALRHQEDLQTLYTGGTVFHVLLAERMASGMACARFVRKVFENTRLPYLTMTPTYSICPEHGYIEGEQLKCPKCGRPTEVYSRIVGYYRPVQNWNPGKVEEFRQRKYYDAQLALRKDF